jgi:putative hydrolase of the HAD superfamily
MVRAVLFDLDDTLFDHLYSSRAALAEVHRVHAADTDFDAFERHHIRYLEEMHVEVLAGRIDLDEARRERFRRVFRALGIPLTPEASHAVALAYRTGYLSARRPIEGAADLLEALHRRTRIGIVSNNLLEEQQDKLAHCKLAPFVDELVVSGETGVSKPNPAIFQIALERLGVAAAHAVMLGDSWPADIVGAYRTGIRAVWYNPQRKPLPDDPPGVDQIHALTPVDHVVTVLLTYDRTHRHS